MMDGLTVTALARDGVKDTEMPPALNTADVAAPTAVATL